MPEEAQVIPEDDILSLARQRIRLEPVPEWTTTSAFDANFRAKHPGPVTELLVDRQIHAEHRQFCFRVVSRLETMDAVQKVSQWRFEFEPQTQSVTLHWIKIRRAESEIDHAKLDKIRVLQREGGLEVLSIRGLCTLLLVLEDVRPGDVLDWCFTTTTHPRLLPGHCSRFFALPLKTEIGKYRVTVQFDANRPMRWKSSASDLAPVETRENGTTRWTWSGENYAGPQPEPEVPLWYMGYPWMQFSDCPDWQTVAAAVSTAWQEISNDPGLDELARQITNGESDQLRRVNKAIRHIQDEFRYLSVNLELGGQIPTSPPIVAARRYGDCKDLSFLLVHLLRRLGVPARPILVNTELRKSINGLLPSASLFNHAVVEFQLQGETRWVDAVAKWQGADSLNRSIQDYGVGLPVDPSATSLAAIPESSIQATYYELRESILMDTSGDYSWLAVQVTARGIYAEQFRHEFAAESVDAIAKRRLQNCANRFGEAKRSGSLEHRDDRDANEFVLAEIFEIKRFLTASTQAGRCVFHVPCDLVMGVLHLPKKEDRLTPFSLPHPCSITQIVEVQSPTLKSNTVRPVNIRSPFLEYSRRYKMLSGFWSVTFAASTLADAVPSEDISDHRKIVAEVREASVWRFILPIGSKRPRRRSDFGQLPPPPRLPSSPFVPAKPKPEAAGAAGAARPIPALETAPGGAPAGSPPKPRRRRHKHHRQKKTPAEIVTTLVIGSSIALVIAVLILIVLAHSHH